MDNLLLETYTGRFRCRTQPAYSGGALLWLAAVCRAQNLGGSASPPDQCGRAVWSSAEFFGYSEISFKEDIPDIVEQGGFCWHRCGIVSGTERMGSHSRCEGWAVSDINVGILYICDFIAGCLRVIMGGWASNSKYPFLRHARRHKWCPTRFLLPGYHHGAVVSAR